MPLVFVGNSEIGICHENKDGKELAGSILIVDVIDSELVFSRR